MLLRTIYCDKNSTFDKSLDEVGSVTIHEQNLQFLEIEMFKVAKNSAPTIFYEIFKKNEQNICYFRNTTEFKILLVKMVYNGLESLFCLGCKVWNMMSVEYEEIEFLLEFKTKIKDCNQKSFPC